MEGVEGRGGGGRREGWRLWWFTHDLGYNHLTGCISGGKWMTEEVSAWSSISYLNPKAKLKRNHWIPIKYIFLIILHAFEYIYNIAMFYFYRIQQLYIACYTRLYIIMLDACMVGDVEIAFVNLLQTLIKSFLFIGFNLTFMK